MVAPRPVTAAVPLNALQRAKGRLAAAVPGATRAALARLLCERVLDACLDASTIDRVLLVAGDAAAAAVGANRAVEAVVAREDGLTAAVRLAERAAGGAALLVVAADLPLVTGADLDAVTAALGGRDGLVVAPSGDGGTSALLRRPAAVVPSAFGPSSASRHLTAARHAGVPALAVDRPALALDVDTPTQLLAAARRDGALAAWLRAHGIEVPAQGPGDSRQAGAARTLRATIKPGRST